MAGIITVPRREHTSLKHIEFLPLSDNRVLAILVFNECDVQNRVLQMRRLYGASELQHAANYLNAAFAGRDVYEVRRVLINELKEAREHVTQLMSEHIGMSDNLFPEPEDEDFVLAGQTNLLNFSDISDNLEQLRRLFDIFNKKQDILQILDHCLYSNGVQIFIGSESGHQILGECSIVTSPYKVDDKVVGVLGVIGPTRMAYERVIPIVDITAKLLGAALDFKH
jgi:heat-inducible transcriptional repressor